MADIRTEKQIYHEAKVVFIKRLINYFILMIPSILIMLSILDLGAYNPPEVSTVVGVVIAFLIEVCICIVVAKNMRYKYVIASYSDIRQDRFINIGNLDINIDLIKGLPIVVWLLFAVFSLIGVVGFFASENDMIQVGIFAWVLLVAYIMFQYYCMRKCVICDLAFTLKKVGKTKEDDDSVAVLVEGVDLNTDNFSRSVENTIKRTYTSIYKCKCCGQKYVSVYSKYDGVVSLDLDHVEIIEEVDDYQ